MPRCGRCRGRGRIKPTIGFGDQVCPKCSGTGEKTQAKPRKISVDYDRPATSCTYEGRAGPCSGRFTWDHVCRREAIIRHIAGPNRRDIDVATAKILRDVLADERNLVPACLGHNLLRESGHPDCQPRPTDLHPHFWDFVAEHGLEPYLPRHLQLPEAA